MKPLAIAIACAAAIAAASGPAFADDDVPNATKSAAPAGVPGGASAPRGATPQDAGPAGASDAVLRVMIGRWVALRVAGGAEVAGLLVGYDQSALVLSVPPAFDVVAFERRSISALRAVDPPWGPPSAVAEPRWVPVEPPARARHFALFAGATPSLGADLDWQYFHAFLNFNWVFPLATGSQIGAGTLGAGVNFPVAAGSRWKWEIYAHYSPAFVDRRWYHAVGFGLGAHYTARGGLTIGFKIPVLGYALRRSTSGSFRDDPEESTAFYYLAAVIGLPLVSVGYRF